MAVVYVREVYKGVGLRVSGVGDSTEASVNRKFLVRVDSFSTSGAAICAAPGITSGDEHPALRGWIAKEFSVDCEDGAGLMWGVNILYKAGGKKLKPDTKLPEDSWTAQNGNELVPASGYYPNPANVADWRPIINSAGSPIEGLKREESEFSWKLVKCFETAAQLFTVSHATSNTTNASAWGGYGPRTWKCDFRSATPKKAERPKRTNPGDTSNENAGADGEMETVEYWEGVFEFRLRQRGWELRPWDMGFMQKVNGQMKPDPNGTGLAAIRGRDGKPVKEPWKLDGHGVAADISANPVALQFPIYATSDFAAKFGQPPG